MTSNLFFFSRVSSKNNVVIFLRILLKNTISVVDKVCGPERSATQPKLYLGPEPVPRMYLAEDEWSVADVAKGTAEDLPCPRHSRATRERPTPRWG